MGVYDRDYYRQESPGRGVMGGMAPVCKWLIAINVVVYLLQLLTAGSRSGGVTAWLDLSPEDVLRRFQFWRLLTAAFCHSPDDVWHLIFNMLGLWMFGNQVESIYGPREFLRFYLTAAFVSAIGFLGIEMVVARLTVDHIPHELGASGAVMGVMMLCAMYYPTMKILIMFVIPIELRWLVAIFVVYDLYPVLRELGGARIMDNVAHAAHLGGLLYGFLYKRFDLRFTRLLADWSWPQLTRKVRTATKHRPEHVRLYEPPQEKAASADLNRRVDEILAKISAQGESSLTESEREVLKEASRRYKKR
jgi:membrane associated rhomboid family serine protease